MRNRLTVIVTVGLVSGCGLWVRPAVAWNSPGHMIIALVAFDEMDSATRAKAIALLHSHPRFREHFEREMPRDLSRDGDDRDRWCFAHAATWPDQVRDSRGGVTRADSDRFNRPWWHFINEPLYLSAADQRQVAGGIRFNVRREPSDDLDDENMNIIQAVKNSSRIVHDQNAPMDMRSVHLCWLLHLVGDSHQPLHAATLVSARRFREGDHGGNYVEIEHGWKLHAFWDDQISSDADYKTILRLAADLEKNAELAASGAEAEESLDIGTWIDESRELAKQYAYTPEVVDKVAAREGHSHLGPLDLPDQYRADAERVSERRAVESAHRLAKLLENQLP